MAGIIGIPGRLQSVQAADFARNPRPTSSECASDFEKLSSGLSSALGNSSRCAVGLPLGTIDVLAHTGSQLYHAEDNLQLRT